MADRDLTALGRPPTAHWAEGSPWSRESPLFIGRVAALARDPAVLSRTGDITRSWELAREYGEALTEILPSLGFIEEGLRRQVEWLDIMSGRARTHLNRD